MDLDHCSFAELPFTELYNDYIQQEERLLTYFEHSPFEPASYQNRINQIRHPEDRQAAVEAVKEFGVSLDLPESALDNADRLADPEAVAVVTGQQPGLYGGPLYTVYKTLTTIKMAQWLEGELERPVVPVFWLGDEDHDFDEMKAIHLPSREQEVQSYALKAQNNGQAAVSGMQLGESFDKIRDELKEDLRDTDFSDRLWDLLDRWYKPGNSMGQAFAGVMNELFGKHGLVIAGSNHPAIKKLLAKPMQTAVNEQQSAYEQLAEQSRQLDEAYHQQVKLYHSNLFYHHPDHGRLKIEKDGANSTWTTGSGPSWSHEELLEQIGEQPERFSPNVFLRPILQDHLLPTVAYVGGPGEIAYYGQMKKFYEVFDLKMPVIVPRLSATLLESGISRIMQKLPFYFSEYERRIEDLEKEYVQQKEEDFDIEAFFEDWKDKTEQLSDQKAEAIEHIDPTLVKAAGKATAAYFNELDQLKGKIYRATKQQEKTQLNRIRRIKHHCFPGDGLQERKYSMLYYMNKYGLDLWDQILDTLDNPPFYSNHELVNL